MIIVAGENLIDFIPNNKKNYTFFVGGSALNTAVTLGRLKLDVYFCSQISSDFFGKIIFDYLKKNKVKTSLIKKTISPTTIAVVAHKKKPEFNLYTKETASINFKKYSLNKKLLKSIKLSHFSSIGLFLKPSGDTFLNMMQDLKKNNKSIISFDPNIRPNIIDNKSEFIKKFKKILKFSDIVKMSNEDFNYLTNQKYDKNTIQKVMGVIIIVAIILLTRKIL